MKPGNVSMGRCARGPCRFQSRPRVVRRDDGTNPHTREGGCPGLHATLRTTASKWPFGGVLTDPVTKETTRHQQLGANPGGMLFLHHARSQVVRGGSCNALVKGSCLANPNPSAAPGPRPWEVTDSGVGSRCGHPRGGCYSVCEVSHVV